MNPLKKVWLNSEKISRHLGMMISIMEWYMKMSNKKIKIQRIGLVKESMILLPQTKEKLKKEM